VQTSCGSSTSRECLLRSLNSPQRRVASCSGSEAAALQYAAGVLGMLAPVAGLSDPIILALASLTIQPGTAVTFRPGVEHGRHKDSASEDVFMDFVEKKGIRSVDPADWQTREAKEATHELGPRRIGRRWGCGNG